MRQLFKSACVLLSLTPFMCLNAQTKKIFHKSHSGNRFTFRKSLTAQAFRIPGFSLGLRFDYSFKTNNSYVYGFSPKPSWDFNSWDPEPLIDSLIVLNDTSVMLVTSSISYFGEPAKSQLHKKTVLNNHPVFSAKKTISEINHVLITSEKIFKAPLSGIKYIGFKPEKQGMGLQWLLAGAGISALTLACLF